MMKPECLLSIFFLTGTVSLLKAAEHTSPVRIAIREEGFLFTEGEAKVLFYQKTPKSLNNRYERRHYVHPVYDLDGNILTEDFPLDHLHHRGVFWAWHQILLGEKRLGDGWTTQGFSWDICQTEVVSGNDESAALKTVVLWKSPLWTDEQGQHKPFVREETLIRVYRAMHDARRIDFTIRLLALEEGLRIGGSDDEKGYGGFSTRIRLPKDIRFIGQAGKVIPDRIALEAGPWLDMSGQFGTSQATSGITILLHDSLPGYPQPWVLRREGSMQNASYPGRRPVELSTRDPLILRYRLILHRGGADRKKIEQWHAEYCAAAEPIGR